ncbi:hypothetical protein SHKM778_53280 [Streptomyces sp. KM77-8]|uniref:PPM-type phosphatase domain-containing protein n=1 Tax=Streptomyces haneummycinicus TaxID=3074435 RepID=A0AAT9HPE3_9ACTN
MEAATRYLPAAHSGVGGDWFDVIPLSGMRVAIVVGEVAGHGIQASTTMGRLRTAVRTLADIDLAPDELLTHLDDLVLHLSHESGGDHGSGEVGATCVYAVYDPVSRRCTLSRAGHPAPVLIPPGGPARHLELPSGPPLGMGGLPFESAELHLPDASVLAFYTDGLVESRGGTARPVTHCSGRRCPVPPARSTRPATGSWVRCCRRAARRTTWPCCWPAPTDCRPRRSPPGTSPPIRRWSRPSVSRSSTSWVPGR